MALLQIDQCLRVANSGDPYPTGLLPPTAAGAELGYFRTVANDAFRYREAIQTATHSRYSVNEVAYPEVDIGARMAALARLIKRKLGARIYVVLLGGFDTHAQQADEHASMLDQLARSLAAFYADLGASGDFPDRTLTMTFSEFGSRIQENGSGGTDHCTAAPVFLFGPAAEGGLHGSEPNLSDLYNDENLKHAIDFREVNASVLRLWFEMSESDLALALGATYDSLPIVSTSPPVSRELSPATPFELAAPAPNPVRTQAPVRFTLACPTRVEMALYDATGRQVRTLASGGLAVGNHAATLCVGGLAAALYVLRFQTEAGTRTQTVTVAR